MPKSDERNRYICNGKCDRTARVVSDDLQRCVRYYSITMYECIILKWHKRRKIWPFDRSVSNRIVSRKRFYCGKKIKKPNFLLMITIIYIYLSNRIIKHTHNTTVNGIVWFSVGGSFIPRTNYECLWMHLLNFQKKKMYKHHPNVMHIWLDL